MRTFLLASAALAAATALAAQTLLFSDAAATWEKSSVVTDAAGVSSITGKSDYTSLSKSAWSYTDNKKADSIIWLGFTAQRTAGNGSAYLSLMDGGVSDNNIVLSIGSIGGETYWQSNRGASAGSSTRPSAIQAPAVSVDTSSLILIRIDYNTGTNNDRADIWRFDSAAALSSFVPTSNSTWNTTGDLQFNRLAVNAASDTTFTFDNLLIGTSYSAVPEPATYALLFGAASLGFVSYRRFRKRRT